MFDRLQGFDTSVFGQLRRLEEELDEVFRGGATLTGTRDIRSLPSGAFPPTNIGATAEEVAVYLFVPGLDPKKLDITVQQNLLSIAGRREPLSPRQGTCYRQERFAGDFRRSITLPEDVDPQRVEAKYSNGILKILIGRRASAKPRQIEVR